MAGNGGPWGGSSNRPPEDEQTPDANDSGPRGGSRNGSGHRPGGSHQIPDIDQIVRKGQEQLRVLMGGRGGGPRGRGPRGGGGGGGLPVQGIVLALAVAVIAWVFASFYTVKTEERSVELFLGKSAGVGMPGLNFAPWPLVTYEKILVTGERTTNIAIGQTADEGLTLTRDQNIVDIGFQVVWNVSDAEDYLFSLESPEDTVRAVSESAMRDIIARSELSPILNRDRGVIAADLRTSVQGSLDRYDSGINVVRVNLQRAQPPSDVIDSFREVQAAQQERDRLEKEADAYSNKVTAGARGDAARIVEAAEAYRAQAVNSAQGEAARFISVYEEYAKAPEITRRRLYLETMEKVFGSMDKVILDGVGGDRGEQGVVPYLPLDLLKRQGAADKEGG